MKKTFCLNCFNFISLLVLSIFIVSCGGGGGGGGASGGGSSGNSLCSSDDFGGSANNSFTAGAGLFTVLPMSNANIGTITALGKINPPAHTFPTDHIYLAFAGVGSGGTAVYAAAGGTVTKIYQPDGVDYKIVIRVDQSFYYYYDHLWSITSGIAVGSNVTAGQQLGLAGGGGGIGAASMDLGVVNYNQTTPGIVNSCRFTMSLHTDAPLKYFDTTNQAILYAKVNRAGSDKDGKIGWDIAVALSGAWMLEGSTDPSGGLASTGWPKQLMFGYDVTDPTMMRIGVGGTLVTSGITYAVQAGASDFSLITPASTAGAPMAYQLFYTPDGGSPNTTQDGLMLVQMLTADRIKVEVFTPSTATTGSFDANAYFYTR